MIRTIREIVKRKLFKDTIVFQAGIFSSSLISLVTSIILTRTLGIDDYGTYVLIFAVFNLFNITHIIGGANAIISKIAEANAGKRPDEIRELIGYYLKFLLIIGVVVAIFGGVFGPWLAELIYGKPLARTALRIVFLTVLLNTFSGLATAVLRGHRLMRHAVALDVGQLIIRIVFISFFLLQGFGVTGVVTAHVLTSAVSSAIALLILNRVRRTGKADIPDLFEMFSEMLHVPIRKYFGFALLVSLSRFILTLFHLVPVFLLGRFIEGTAAVGFFNLGFHISTALLGVFMGLSKNLLPYLSELKGRGNIAILKDRFIKITISCGIIGIIIAGAFSAAAKNIILYLYKEQWMPVVPVLYVLMVQFVFTSFGIAATHFYTVTERVRFAILVRITLLVLCFPIGVWLIKSKEEFGAAIYYSGLVSVMMAVYLFDILYRIKKS